MPELAAAIARLVLDPYEVEDKDAALKETLRLIETEPETIAALINERCDDLEL